MEEGEAMSHFYGTLQGNRGEATRCGTKDSGMHTTCASWQGAVECYAYVDVQSGDDWVVITFNSWFGAGSSRLIYRGPISGAPAVEQVEESLV